MRILKPLISISLASLVLLPMSLQAKKPKRPLGEKPIIVGTPPSDAGRGLIRVSKKEIRHYTGGSGSKSYLVSQDNGKTWSKGSGNADYPGNYGGIKKEAPAIARNPKSKEFIRVQPIRGFVFISKGGIDGKWGAVTKKGTLDFNWQDKSRHANYLKLGGIMRTPTFVKKGKRLIIPFHGGGTTGASFHISDDGGLTWTKSKTTLKSPPHQKSDIDKGYRWQNLCVEGTLMELKNGKLWTLLRTSQNQHYETFSSDYGMTWSKAEPSRFFGQCTMQTMFRMKDGRLVSSWTNTQVLPENITATGRGEDAFTNRDSHHLAISEDDGETWFGFREIILDENRNKGNYATYHGREDRGKHQSEIVQIDKNKILISLGQHHVHRRLMIIDLNFLYEKKRQNKFENELEDWTVHTYIPQKKGHCAYNRKQGSFLIEKGGKKMLQIRRITDASLTDTKKQVDYQKNGATWNFPNGKKGRVSFTFKLDKDHGGTQVSLTDRLFNACDESTQKLSIFTLKLKKGKKIGPIKLKANKTYKLSLKWKGVGSNSKCIIYLNKKKVKTIKAVNSSPNGISYIHFISTAEKEDQGLYIESIKASVK